VPAGWGLTSLNPMVAAKCQQNTYGHNETRVAVANARCTACPSNMFTIEILDERALNAGDLYISEAACLVKAGWGTTSTIPQECPVGTYNAGKNRLACQHCDTGFTTVGTAKTSGDACVVQPGWKMGSDGIPAPCDKGTYSTGGTEAAPNATCSNCGDGYSTQEDEATTVDECAVCAPGYGGAAGVCAVCDPGFYSSGGAAPTIACQQCAVGSTSSAGSTHSQQCYSTLIDASADVFALQTEAAWDTTSGPAASADTAVDCGTACDADDTCIMYKFVTTNAETGGGTCGLLHQPADAGDRTHKLGFKISNGADYAMWGLDQAVGAELTSQPQAAVDATTEVACKDACTATAECEVYVLQGTTCKLAQSEYESAAISMFHVVGTQLFSSP
jgi:hypothetical protein